MTHSQRVIPTLMKLRTISATIEDHTFISIRQRAGGGGCTVGSGVADNGGVEVPPRGEHRRLRGPGRAAMGPAGKTQP